ncbi:MAG: hypothetical protein KDC98_18595 [Planctomycetes bacterium]|nr:hypothetical protein [Planctomycetota bacterium]
MVPRAFVAALIPCIAVTAQSLTVPSSLAGVEGGSATNVPFGSNLACRYQCIYDASVLPWSGPRQISGINLRADNGNPLAPGSPINAKGYLTISVLMSTTATGAAGASSDFDSNRGADATWVLRQHRLWLPAQPALTAPGPRQANISFLFPSWWYGLTPARPGAPAPANLLIEFWIHDQPQGSYPIDSPGGCLAANTTFGRQDPLCGVPGQPLPTLGSAASMIAGRNFSWYVDHAPADAGFVILFALSGQGHLFGNTAYPLPYPMFDPLAPSRQSPALSTLIWPAPDCWINIESSTSVFGQCNASGHGVLTTMLPPGSQNVGLELFTQAFIISQSSNPLGVISTQGYSSTVCGPLDVTRIHAFYDGSATPPPPPPTSGSVLYGVAMIVEVL